MIPVVTSREMRAADRAAVRRGVPSIALMENAAAAIVDEIASCYPGWRRVMVVCGPGQNGGDGLAAARMLSESGVAVDVWSLADPSGYRADAAENRDRAADAGLPISLLSVRRAWDRFAAALRDADGILDALFGTGLSRPLTGAAKRAVAAINASGRPVVAADLPSGLSADSADPIGPCVRAARTVALGAPKTCHVFAPARDLCGRVVIRDIGIPRDALPRRRPRVGLVEAADLRRLLADRPANSHKGDFGRVAVVAGSRGKEGAAVLAARGALRAGAGLVTVFGPLSVAAAVAASLPEAMTRALPERDGALAGEAAASLRRDLRDFDAAVAGPGLSTSPGARAALEEILAVRAPLVCDADALNAFAGRASAFARRRFATVLTPHPGEAGRLMSVPTARVQARRLETIRRLAAESRSVVLLKGDATLTATPAGRVSVNPTGTPLLATAGSGDVLAGALGALLAAGLPAEEAALAAAWLHGAAGQLLEERLGDAGLLAHELADALPEVRRRLRSGWNG
ncbi:MAG: NAD(P)H-hydrate dehydratase [Acidobacteriota bacterium]